MTRAAGSNAVVTLCQEATWGTTPAALAGSDQLYTIGLKSESIKSTKNNFESDMINAFRCTIGLGDGNKAVEGNIVSDLLPEGLELLIMHLLGNPTVTTTGSGPYTHVMKGSSGNFTGLTIEKEFTDIGQFMTYTGCRLNTMAISLVQEGFHEVTFGFVGKAEALDTTTKLPSGTPVTFNKSGFTGYQCKVYTTMDPATGLVTDHYHQLNFVTAGNININNNLETDGYVLGSGDRASVQYGKRSCTGDFTVFFEDAKLYNLYANGTECGVKFEFDNGIGQKLTFEFPTCKLSGNAPEIASFQGLNMSLNFSARYNSTSLTDVIVTIVNTIATLEAGN